MVRAGWQAKTEQSGALILQWIAWMCAQVVFLPNSSWDFSTNQDLRQTAVKEFKQFPSCVHPSLISCRWMLEEVQCMFVCLWPLRMPTHFFPSPLSMPFLSIKSLSCLAWLVLDTRLPNFLKSRACCCGAGWEENRRSKKEKVWKTPVPHVIVRNYNGSFYLELRTRRGMNEIPGLRTNIRRPALESQSFVFKPCPARVWLCLLIYRKWNEINSGTHLRGWLWALNISHDYCWINVS